MNDDRPRGLVEGSGRRGDSRRLDQMVSVRLAPTLVALLRGIAANRGISLSDVIREAALLLIKREEASNLVTFEVNVTNEHLGGIERSSVRQDIDITV